MSLPPDHHAEALAALKLIQAADNPVAEMSSASEATAHAVLAVQQTLTEIAEQLRIGNTIAAFQSGALDGTDFDHAYAAVRCVLGLSPIEKGENR